MGGHAFGTILGPSAIFPRMDLTTYERLREYVTCLLTPRFSSPVVVAREDPAKINFGDLDIVVLNDSYLGEKGADEQEGGMALKPGPLVEMREELRVLLGAERAVSNGSGFISFAIATPTLERCSPNKGTLAGSLGSTHNAPAASAEADDLIASLDALTVLAEDAAIYHQVDINLAKTQDEMEAMPFYNSYGDLGMILSLVCKTLGMSYSVHGLKIVLRSYTTRIERPFLLSTATPAILSFLGLDYPRWKRGFNTRAEIYMWILSSRFAHVGAILGVSPKHLERPMYQEFLRHVEQRQQGEFDSQDSDTAPEPDQVVQQALEFFGRAEEYEGLAKAVEQRKKLKQVLNGRVVQEATGLHGSVVGKIIVAVKKMATPEELVALSQEKVLSMIEEASRSVLPLEKSPVASDLPS